MKQSTKDAKGTKEGNAKIIFNAVGMPYSAAFVAASIVGRAWQYLTALH